MAYLPVLRYIISSLDMFSSIAENLINYTFNVRDNAYNDIKRRANSLLALDR
jgi:hypothetical protein